MASKDPDSINLGTINLSEESMNVQVKGCGQCGAITAITFNGRGIDSSAAHGTWHEKNPDHKITTAS